MDSHTRLLQGICCCEKQGVEDCYTSSRCFKYNLLDCFTSRKSVWLQGDLKVAFRGFSSRLRRSLRVIVEVVASFQPATTSTITLKVSPLAG